MSKYINNIVIVTDIFGTDQHISKLVQILSRHVNKAIKVIDPYNGSLQCFTNDKEAYQAFIEQCGHQYYSEKVQQALKQITTDTIVIGFSAGASAVWQNTREENHEHLKHVIGFYPSQIRNQLDVKPCCDVTLIFPIKEPHFNLNEIIQVLSKNEKVNCFKTIYNHGFMNPSSNNYSKSAAHYFSKTLSSMTKISELTTLLIKQKIHFIKE